MQKLLKQTIQPLMPVVLIGTAAQALLLSVFFRRMDSLRKSLI
ncbi:hypothetical protein [Lacticaseibacillus manihotivorans]|nr:hypothetical protein [Lacticaseibacillus manihotivorans]